MDLRLVDYANQTANESLPSFRYFQEEPSVSLCPPGRVKDSGVQIQHCCFRVFVGAVHDAAWHVVVCKESAVMDVYGWDENSRAIISTGFAVRHVLVPGSGERVGSYLESI